MAKRMDARRAHRSHFAAALGVIVLAVALASCSAPPAPVETVYEPPPVEETEEPTPTLTSAELEFRPDDHWRGAKIVVAPTDKYRDESVVLYSTSVPTGIPLDITVRSNERLRAVSWAVESDPGAPPTATAIAFIAAEASGLNGAPDRLELRTYDANGHLDSTAIVPGFTGIPSGFEGYYVDVAAGDAVMVNGVLVLSVITEDRRWNVIGVDSGTGDVLWARPAEYVGWSAPVPSAGLALIDVDGVISAVNAATGVTAWTTGSTTAGRAYPHTFAASPYAHIAPDAGYGSEYHDAQNGTLFPVPPGYDSWAVDQIDGSLALSWSGVRFLVLDTAGQIVFDLGAEQAALVGSFEVLGAYDGRIWIENSSGIDIIVAATGERDAFLSANSGTLVRWSPVDGNQYWTLLSTSQYSDGVYKLVMHPGGAVGIGELGLH